MRGLLAVLRARAFGDRRRPVGVSMEDGQEQAGLPPRACGWGAVWSPSV
ncbi:hypothetical protein ACIBG6_36175 [Streptomyces sp. NPDC050842]